MCIYASEKWLTGLRSAFSEPEGHQPHWIVFSWRQLFWCRKALRFAPTPVCITEEMVEKVCMVSCFLMISCRWKHFGSRRPEDCAKSIDTTWNPGLRNSKQWIMHSPPCETTITEQIAATDISRVQSSMMPLSVTVSKESHKRIHLVHFPAAHSCSNFAFDSLSPADCSSSYSEWVFFFHQLVFTECELNSNESWFLQLPVHFSSGGTPLTNPSRLVKLVAELLRKNVFLQLFDRKCCQNRTMLTHFFWRKCFPVWLIGLQTSFGPELVLPCRLISSEEPCLDRTASSVSSFALRLRIHAVSSTFHFLSEFPLFAELIKLLKMES